MFSETNYALKVRIFDINLCAYRWEIFNTYRSFELLQKAGETLAKDFPDLDLKAFTIVHIEAEIVY